MYFTLCRRVAVNTARQNEILITELRLAHKGYKFDTFQERNAQESNSAEQYPEVQKLQLPMNFKELPNSEEISFSKQRTRDLSESRLAMLLQTNWTEGPEFQVSDSTTGKYYSSNMVNLSSSMQTNVPDPFRPNNKSTHLNMPRGHWRQQMKYISEMLHSLHPTKHQGSSVIVKKILGQSKASQSAESRIEMVMQQSKRYFTQEVKSSNESIENPKKLTSVQRLRAAVVQYGSTIVVLHICVSLISLGFCYGICSSGIDLSEIVQKWGWSEGAANAEMMGKVVLTYAVHKMLLPVRVTIAITLAPIVVRYLKKKGFKLKKMNQECAEKKSNFKQI